MEWVDRRFIPLILWYIAIAATSLYLYDYRIIFPDISAIHLSPRQFDNLDSNRDLQNHLSKSSTKRIALLRPFSSKRASSLVESFDIWDEFPPCREKDTTEIVINDQQYEIHIILSYSQSYSSSTAADNSTTYLIENFQNYAWSRKCISSIRRIETGIPPGEDLYNPAEAGSNRMWVNGPNLQFLNSIEAIQAEEGGSFDYVVLMESDVIPVRHFWLDILLNEISLESESAGGFAIIGSKFAGTAWDSFRSNLPLALLNHMNGNAVYNLRHPLFHFLLIHLRKEQSRSEAHHSIPYDYRISQILLEGFLGEKPDLAPAIVDQWKIDNGKTEITNNKKEFRSAWDSFGVYNGVASVRESKVIKNFSGCNLLQRHIDESESSLIHGAKVFHGWKETNREISLLVSEWHDELVTNLLGHIDESNHPFTTIDIILPHDIAPHSKTMINNIETKVKLQFHTRESSSDGFDLCNVHVEAEWFMITNAYHVVQQNVDLLFNNDLKVVITALPATHEYCFAYPSCRHVMERSHRLFGTTEFYLVRDADMVFHTQSMKKFCSLWKKSLAEEGNTNASKNSSSVGLIASAFVSYLEAMKLLDNFYELSSSPGYEHFKRFISIEEEQSATNGDTAVANRILGGQRAVATSIGHELDYYTEDQRIFQLLASANIPTVNSPNKNAPTVNAPNFNAPAANAPTFNVPTVNTPTFNAPAVNAPSFIAPAVNAPTFNAPTVNNPTFNAPAVNAPTLNTPAVNVPTFNTPAVNAPTLNTPTVNAPTFNTPVDNDLPTNAPIGNAQPNNVPTPSAPILGGPIGGKPSPTVDIPPAGDIRNNSTKTDDDNLSADDSSSATVKCHLELITLVSAQLCLFVIML